MDNKLYRIEVLMHDNLPTIDTAGILTTNEGFAFVKLHPVRLTARPKCDSSYGQWDIDKSFCPFVCTCSKCGAIYDVDGAFEWNYCPNCGAKMDGDKHE